MLEVKYMNKNNEMKVESGELDKKKTLNQYFEMK